MKKIAAAFIIFSFATIAMAFPPLPDDLNIAQPDPSLPKELTGFLGKWEGDTNMIGAMITLFLIVERVSEEEAVLFTAYSDPVGWDRVVARVERERRGNYVIWFPGRRGINQLRLKKGSIELSVPPSGLVILKKVN